MNFRLEHYSKFKEHTITGRYVVNEQIIAFLAKKSTDFQVDTIGQSFQNRAIKSITLGEGEKKILMWSQMHGNESTTTKSVLDLINLLYQGSDIVKEILNKCTLKIIPILNPDGARVYTRVNANQVDLNRDAQNLSQPESKALRAIYDDFKPDFCFNLHDQRTIYNVGNTSKPATVSFLSPAFNDNRDMSRTRLRSMALIHEMNIELQKVIPGQVGRYDDSFNANCVGDAFQMLDTPTILFEAGHYPKDYEREKTREYIFRALLKAIYSIANFDLMQFSEELYFGIPENQKRYFDVLVKNVPTPDSLSRKDVGILYLETLKDGKISFTPNIERQGSLDGFFGHETYDFLNSKDVSHLRKTGIGKLLNV